MGTVSLKFSADLERKLIAAARDRGESKSEIILEALRNYLASEGVAEPGSCLDLSRDLVGCMEGPPDLSYNKKHMTGFGT